MGVENSVLQDLKHVADEGAEQPPFRGYNQRCPYTSTKSLLCPEPEGKSQSCIEGQKNPCREVSNQKPGSGLLVYWGFVNREARGSSQGAEAPPPVGTTGL